MGARVKINYFQTKFRMTIVKPETKTNKKQKYTLEFEIKSSPKILYNYLSTASGLEEWFADKVNIREGDFIFHWEGSEQRARIINKKKISWFGINGRLKTKRTTPIFNLRSFRMKSRQMLP